MKWNKFGDRKPRQCREILVCRKMKSLLQAIGSPFWHGYFDGENFICSRVPGNFELLEDDYWCYFLPPK